MQEEVKKSKLFIVPGTLFTLAAIILLIFKRPLSNLIRFFGSIRYMFSRPEQWQTYLGFAWELSKVISIILLFAGLVIFAISFFVRIRKGVHAGALLCAFGFLFSLIGELAYAGKFTSSFVEDLLFYSWRYFPKGYFSSYREILAYVIFVLLAMIAMFVAASREKKNRKTNGEYKKWLAPGMIMVVAVCARFVIRFAGDIALTALGIEKEPGGILFTWAAFYLLVAAALFFGFRWLAFSEATVLVKEKPVGQYGLEYRDIFLHTLLLLITFGVYQFVWIFKTTRSLNSVDKGEHRLPANKMLMCMFLPLYSVYWTYKTASIIDAYAPEKGVHSDIKGVASVFAIFAGPLAPVVIQDKINSIVISVGNQSMGQ